ncbi:hypothetical protein DWG18_00365 [Lysobacter sp. TY2-98]|nr:hypothetical protein DWG18_00365 [Lysobacter sp. TY2-98]
MHNKSLLVLAVVLLAACDRGTAPVSSKGVNAAVTTSPTAEQMPVKYETVPLAVDPAKIEPQDVAMLASATWTAKQCALTTPEGVDELAAVSGAPTHFAGFFIDPSDKPAGDFDIVLKGAATNYRIPVRTGWERADVGEYFKVPALAAAGFEADVALTGAVPAGRYKVDFVVERNGAKFFCESGKTLVIN